MLDISLREIVEDDTEMIVRWRNKENIKKFFCEQDDITPESHLHWFHNNIATGKTKQFIIQDNQQQKDIGTSFLKDIDFKNKKAEFGIFIGEDTGRGKGIGTQSVILTVQYAFQTLKLHKVFLRVFSSNEIAIKAYQKAGFKEEGIAKEDILLPNDQYQDIVFMSIINEGGK